jgi:glycerol-3-phosphate acyltransferase PlsY
MTLGARAGCAIGIIDMLKIAAPTLAFKLMFAQPEYSLIAATGGMIGHNWPIFNRFRGGRGISSVYGAMFVIDWIGTFSIAFGGLFLGLIVFRDFMVAYLAGLWLLIPWMWFRFQDWSYLGFAIAVNIIFIIAMIPDIRQYLRFRKEGKTEMDAVMGITPMGRGMLKIMTWLRLRRR